MRTKTSSGVRRERDPSAFLGAPPMVLPPPHPGSTALSPWSTVPSCECGPTGKPETNSDFLPIVYTQEPSGAWLYATALLRPSA